MWSGALVTAGDVAFYGTMDRWFKAVDAKNGKVLWQFHLGSGTIGQPVTYQGADGEQYVAILTGVGGWPGAVANAQIDPRVRNAALGFVGATQDLPSYTQGGGELVVFAVPKQEAAWRVDAPAQSLTLGAKRRCALSWSPLSSLLWALRPRLRNRMRPVRPVSLCSPKRRRVPRFRRPGHRGYAGRERALLRVREPDSACARLRSPPGKCLVRAKDQQSARSGPAGDDARHAGFQSVQLRWLSCGERRRRHGSSAERGPVHLRVDAPRICSSASIRAVPMGCPPGASSCRSRRSGSLSPTSRASRIRRAQPSDERSLERRHPRRSNRRPSEFLQTPNPWSFTTSFSNGQKPVGE